MSDSVSGISRSGRVRKKSAKLIEMEDLDSPEGDGDADSKNRKKMLKVTPTTLVLGGGELDAEGNRKVAPIKIWSRPPGSTSKQVTEGGAPTPVAGSVLLTALPASGYISDHPSLVVPVETPKPAKKPKGKMEVAGKAMMTPLKVNVGDATKVPENLRDDSSGLRLKFILSPKEKTLPSDADVSSSDCSPTKSPGSGSSGKDKKKKKKPPKSPKNENGKAHESAKGKSHEGSASSHSKSKAKKPSAKHSQLSVGSSPNGFDGAELGDSSDLVIAEPLPKVPKKKKAPSSHRSSTGSSKKSPEASAKVKVKIEPVQNFYPDEPSDADDLDSNHTMLSSNSISQSQSVYLTERKKGKKKKQGKVVMVNEKVKPKGRPMTAYMLWCREHRRRIVADNPDMDFASISRRLGEAWQCLSDKEKLCWRRKAKKLSAKTSNLINTSKSDRGGKVISRQQKVIPAETDCSTHLRDMYKVVGIAPIDVAAHLKLLGESLSIIGQRLTEHEGQIAVSGSLSVLLDSTLCALGPLLCLTAEVPETNGCHHDKLGTILDNIAYIMPGL